MLSLVSQSLADGLKRNLVLKKLDLCENRIDLEGAMALAEIFRLNNGSFSIIARHSRMFFAHGHNIFRLPFM